MIIDSTSPRRIILPIRLGIDHIEGLLVASFEGDPEFEGIEPQVFDDPINGRDMRVLRYRKDGMVDVYWQPGVRVDRSTFTVGKGIVDFAETTMEPAHLKITDRGMELFTRVVGMFRTWPATYCWQGVVELGAAPVMSGVWERKGGSG